MSDLTVNQVKAIVCLLEHDSVIDAAECAGVSRRTLDRWLDDPAFNAELQQAESTMIDTTARIMASGAAKAVGHLNKIIDDQSEKTSDRIRAAAVILNNLLRIQELRQIDQRLADIERRLNEKGN